MIIAALDQALRTNYRKSKMEKSSSIAMCKAKEETATPIVSECFKKAHTEYKKRHDRVAT